MLKTSRIDQASVAMDNPFNPAGVEHAFGVMAFGNDGNVVYLDHSVSRSSRMAEALSKLYDWYETDAAATNGLERDSVRTVFYKGAIFA